MVYSLKYGHNKREQINIKDRLMFVEFKPQKDPLTTPEKLGILKWILTKQNIKPRKSPTWRSIIDSLG